MTLPDILITAQLVDRIRNEPEFQRHVELWRDAKLVHIPDYRRSAPLGAIVRSGDESGEHRIRLRELFSRTYRSKPGTDFVERMGLPPTEEASDLVRDLLHDELPEVFEGIRLELLQSWLLDLLEDEWGARSLTSNFATLPEATRRALETRLSRLLLRAAEILGGDNAIHMIGERVAKEILES